MLERFALPSALHQIAQWRQFRAIKRTLELEIELHPRAPEHVRKQVFRVQSRVVDLVLSEIRRRRLQDFEQGLRFCHVERSRDISRYFRNSKRFLYFGRNDRRRVLTPKSTTLSTAPPYRRLGARESSRRGRHQAHDLNYRALVRYGGRSAGFEENCRCEFFLRARLSRSDSCARRYILPLPPAAAVLAIAPARSIDRKSTRLNSSHSSISYAVFCLKKKNSNAIVEVTTPLNISTKRMT